MFKHFSLLEKQMPSKIARSINEWRSLAKELERYAFFYPFQGINFLWRNNKYGKYRLHILTNYFARLNFLKEFFFYNPTAEK